MRIAFRIDASVQIGSGHLMRCLTLADALHGQGAECQFICRKHEGHMMSLIEQRGYPVKALPASMNTFNPAAEPAHAAWLGCDWEEDAVQTQQAIGADVVDWLIVDHYALDRRWHQTLRPSTKHLMVIDDLADRSLDCDLLLDQNFYLDRDRRYEGLVPAHCITLLGPDYVLLRPEFSHMRQRLRDRDGMVKRLFVFFGSTDPGNQTALVLAALRELGMVEIAVDVVVGAANPWSREIEAACSDLPNVLFHRQISNMAELMASADLGIGAGGSAMWERCCLGLPTIVVVTAANQMRTTEDVAQQGGIVYLGRAEEVSVGSYLRALKNHLVDSERIRHISNRALELVKPSGVSIFQIMQDM